MVSLPDQPSEAEVLGVGKFVGVGWRMLGKRFRLRPLEREEERELAEAAIPVLAKYGGGFLEKWGAEISFGIVAVGLWDRTRLPADPAPATPPPGEAV